MPLNVVMIGSKGCGKTSTLAVMLHDVEQFINTLTANNPLFQETDKLPEISSGGMSASRLMDAYGQLRNLVADAKKHPDDINMIAGEIIGDETSNVNQIKFVLGDVSDTIQFWDFPGGFFSRKQIEKGRFQNDRKTWEKRIEDADIILLSVDASYQLQPRGRLKYDESYYERIMELIKKSISNNQNPQSRKMLVFMPVKCEHMVLDASYDSEDKVIDLSFDEHKSAGLQSQVVDLFPGLLDFCKKRTNSVDVFFVPMITVGGIKCNRIKLDDSDFENSGLKATVGFGPILPEHHRVTPFKPMNCDRVFALCLWKMLNSLAQQWATNHKFKSFFSWFFDNPVQIFFEKLLMSIGMGRMWGNYMLRRIDDEPDLTPEDRQSLKKYLEDLIKESPATAGCSWLS